MVSKGFHFQRFPKVSRLDLTRAVGEGKGAHTDGCQAPTCGGNTGPNHMWHAQDRYISVLRIRKINRRQARQLAFTWVGSGIVGATHRTIISAWLDAYYHTAFPHA